MNADRDEKTPMALAEAAQCCGMFFGEVPETPCLNCPLLVERHVRAAGAPAPASRTAQNQRREELLRHARAM